MKQVILTHNSTTSHSLASIRTLLSEHDLAKNIIKQRVLCVDKPQNRYKLQEFLGFDKFTFLADSQNGPWNLNMRIDQILSIQIKVKCLKYLC